MSTITLAIIESQIETLNSMTERTNAYAKYALDQAYGGVRLTMRYSKNGSESDISTRGTKKELSNILSAIINVLSREA